MKQETEHTPERTISVGGKLIYTGETVIEDAYVNYRGSSVVSVSQEPVGDVIGTYPVITPAFVDAHSHIGMARAGEPSSENEANEQLDSILPLADALDSVMMDDSAFEESIEAGVLYSCVLPGSGNIIGGRGAVIRNYGADTNRAFIAPGGVKAAFGYNPMSTRTWKGNRPYTRMGALSLLRGALEATRSKLAEVEGDESKLDASQRVFRDLLYRRDRLRVHVHKSDDIAALLRFVDEYKLSVTAEHTGDVHDEDTYRELARRRIPVVIGPLDSFPYKVEVRHRGWRNLRHAKASGVQLALMTDHPVIQQYTLRNTLRHFMRVGYTPQECIELITRCNAEFLGIADRVGVLRADRWASFLGWNGDPFQLSSFPTLVVGEGRRLYEE